MISAVKDKLNRIRMPGPSNRKNAVLTAVISFAAGAVLGVGSKWLDDLALDSTIWWHRLFEALDLGNFFSEFAVWLLLALIIAVFSRSALLAALNVFAFFAGMCAAYHLYSILFSGFNPASYMMIWYGITLLSPLLAVLCWYAKGRGVIAVILDIGIFAVFFLSCFAMGFFYVDVKGILYLLALAASVLVLYQSPKQLLISLPVGFLLSFLTSSLRPYL